MSVDFFPVKCITKLNDSLFGLCDITPRAAFINKTQDGSWIATVINKHNYEVTFVAVDVCLELKKDTGELDSSCDCLMTYNSNIIFVELKESDTDSLKWIRKADDQLRNTIKRFEQSNSLDSYSKKEAYISNNQRPQFRTSQKERMEKFKDETGVRLKIMATIELL